MWLGGLGASLLGWLAIGCVVWGSYAILTPLWLRGSLPPFAWPFVLAWWIAAFLVICFVVGLVCAFFWQTVTSRKGCNRWAISVAMAMMIPGFAGNVGCLVFIAFGSGLALINKGLDCGYQWWPNHPWHAFFGLTNQWERDDE